MQITLHARACRAGFKSLITIEELRPECYDFLATATICRIQTKAPLQILPVKRLARARFMQVESPHFSGDDTTASESWCNTISAPRIGLRERSARRLGNCRWFC